MKTLNLDSESMAQVLTLQKSSPRVKKAKFKKDEKRPEWNDAISDLSIHRPSAQELERKRLMCKSKNAEIAKLALSKKDFNRLSKKSDSPVKDKDKTIVLKNVLFESDNKLSGRSPRESPKKRTATKNLNGFVKSHERYSPVKFAGKPVVTPAPKTPSDSSDIPFSISVSPKSADKRFSTPRSRRQSPASSDSSPIRRIGRCANKLQSICSRSDSMANLNNQRLDNLVQILKKLSSALDALETKVSPTMDAEGDKPKVDGIGNVAAFNEQLLSEFCRLVNLFQTVTQQLDKERNLREELSLEVIRQGTLIEELSVELLQIECQHLSQTTTDDKDVISFGKSRGDALGPETCMMSKRKDDKNLIDTKSKSSAFSRSSFKRKVSKSLPNVLERPQSPVTPMDGNVVTLSVEGDQLRKRSNLAFTLSSTARGQLMKVDEEMAAVFISTVCASDCSETRIKPTTSNSTTALTYVVEDVPPSAFMLKLPQQFDTRPFQFDSQQETQQISRKSSSCLHGDVVNNFFLGVDASWLPDVATLQRSSPTWSPSMKSQLIKYPQQWPDPLPPPPSREQSPLNCNNASMMVSTICRSNSSSQVDKSPLITDCHPPFSFDDSVSLDLFQESTDNSELSHTLEPDSNVVMSSSAEGEFGSYSDTETGSDRRENTESIKKDPLDIKSLFSKLEVLQTHYRSAHIKLQTLNDKTSVASTSPLNSDEMIDMKNSTNDLSTRCENNERCQQNG